MKTTGVAVASTLALGAAANPVGGWGRWHGGEKWGGWTTKTWGSVTWSEPWPSPTESVSYATSTPSGYETSPTSYATSTPTSYATSTPTGYTTSKPSSYQTSSPSSYMTSKPSSYETSSPSSYMTSKPSSYMTSSPSSYMTSKPSSYETSSPSSYMTSTPSSYMTSSPSVYTTSKATSYMTCPTGYLTSTVTSYVTSCPTSYASSPTGYTHTQTGWAPNPSNWWPGPPSACINSEQATSVANNFRDTIASPFSTALAQSAFSTTFEDYSDSVIELINSGCAGPVPLGSATFNSLAAFIKGQSSQAPIPFNIMNIWYGCNSVHIRWAAQPGPNAGIVNPEQQVTGIIAIEVVPSSVSAQYPWLIQTVYSEFNSGAWLYDLGVLKPTNCSTAPPARRGLIGI